MIRKKYIYFCILLIIGAISLFGFQFYSENANKELKAKIRDLEIRHYTITSKNIIKRFVDEPYGCYISFESFNSATSFEVQSEAKGSSSKSNSKSSGSPPSSSKNNTAPPKSSTPPRSNSRTKQGNNYQYDQDISPDDNPQQPSKGKAPSGKRWICNYRSVPRYDYIAKDSDNSSYIYGNNLGSENENPDNWNSVNVGDSLAKMVEYENYFLAGTDPIFSPMKSEKLSYQEILFQEAKTYGPKNTLIDQVFQPKKFFEDTDLKTMNTTLMKTNSFLNNSENKKQVNLQLFYTDEGQDDYIRQLCVMRDGCNKNDLILAIQLDQNKVIKRIQGYSWSQSGFDIAIKLDSDLTTTSNKISNIDEYNIFLTKTQELIKEKFVRKEMSEFKYIKDSLILNLKR